MTQLNMLAAAPVKSEGRASPARSKLPASQPSPQFGNCLKKLVQKTSQANEPVSEKPDNGNQPVLTLNSGNDDKGKEARTPVNGEKGLKQNESVDQQKSETSLENNPDLQEVNPQAAADVLILNAKPALVQDQNPDVSQSAEGTDDSLNAASSKVLAGNITASGIDELQEAADETEQIPASSSSGCNLGEEVQLIVGEAPEQIELSKLTTEQVPAFAPGNAENTGVPLTAGDAPKPDFQMAVPAINPENTSIVDKPVGNSQPQTTTAAESQTEMDNALPADSQPVDEAVKRDNTRISQHTGLIKGIVPGNDISLTANAAEPEILSNTTNAQGAAGLVKSTPEPDARDLPAENGGKAVKPENVVLQPEALQLYLASQKRNKSSSDSAQTTKPESVPANSGDAKVVEATVSKEANLNPEKAALKLKNLPAVEVQNSGSAAGNEDTKATDVKKLIEFESKRFSSEKPETGLAKNEMTLNSKTAESSENVQWLGKTGGESLKNQVGSLLNVSDPSSANVDSQEIVEQVVKKAELMLKLNSSEIKIQLQPEFLGKMTIKILVEDGAVTARFITDSHQVKHMLDSNLNTLRQSLESQGIRVEKTEVNVQLNNGGLFDGSEGNREDAWQQQQQRFTPSYQQGGDLTDGYQLLMAEDDESMLPPAEDESYGISRDGSMNFVI